MIESIEQRIVDAAITSRRSIRAFLDKEVATEDIKDILSIAARAPSSTNAQPWKVYVLYGDLKKTVSNEIRTVFFDPCASKEHTLEYKYYPGAFTFEYAERRRKVGYGLYSLLGIDKRDKSSMQHQHARNFDFFDAPIGLIFTMERTIQDGMSAWLDYGMFIQNIMIAARARGLDTCVQGAFAQFHKILKVLLDLPKEEMVVCGMSLGYADSGKIENTLVSERETPAGFAKFLNA
ncbi:nitroreductase [Variovorax boronicumulans]|uniref:nitroreductase n=1 Tax=Variovorax boronicumulans TaxID=436515 RepID=UPI002789F535|nr:nitroreductase [Variovorax boronicumulans]MDP9996328.1 nitroreductase [Variovorax boronicumulans]MDQ0007578.1 nitroreductase [Variovorax boronicumulans]